MKKIIEFTKRNDIGNLLGWRDFRLKIFLEGIIVGCFVGLIVVLFRLLVEKAELLRQYTYQMPQALSFEGIAIRFVMLIFIAWLISEILRMNPLTSGSGIPQVKGYIQGQIKVGWAKLLVFKFIGTALSIGAGLSLGREGPTVQMGASVGQGISKLLGRLRMEEKYLVTSGVAAGLAAAFNAPLAGAMFAMEEVHKSFSPAVLMSAMAASLTSDFVMRQFFGAEVIIGFKEVPLLPLKYYGLLIGLGIFCGLAGVVYSKTLLKTNKMYDSLVKRVNFLPKRWIPVIPLLFAGILGFCCPQVLGGGEGLVNSLDDGTYGLKVLIILLIVKFLFTMMSAASGAPGGIFFPMLVLGALVGSIYANIIVMINANTSDYVLNFVVFAMAAFFTAVVKAPITGSILIMEMTGSIEHLLPLIMVSMFAYIVSDILKCKPIYDDLYVLMIAGTKKKSGKKYKKKYCPDQIIDKEKNIVDIPKIENSKNTKMQMIIESTDDVILDKNEKVEFVSSKKSKTNSENKRKTIIEQIVCMGSRIEEKRVKDINWPQGCLIVSIRNGEEDVIPEGNTIIMTGDNLYVLVDQDEEYEMKVMLEELCGERYGQKIY